MTEATEYRVAVAHEHYPERGGGEMVADELARTFDADVYAGFVNEDATSEDVAVHDLFGDGIAGGFIRRSIILRDAYYQFAWADAPELRDFDVVVTSGNNPGWFVPRDDQTVVSYVHSPQRTPYDRWAESDSNHGPVAHLYAKAARQFHPEGKYSDRLVANSELVRRRIVRYWGVSPDDVDVVYPPVDVDEWSRHDRETGDYYVTWSRLYPSKHIETIVRACTRAGVNLVVGGTGPERKRLERIAGPTVEFRGFVEWDELRQLVSGAKATIFAAENEDFGMVPIESMAAGTPVIGVRDGFTEFQISDDVNGLLFDRSVPDLVEVIEQFEEHGVRSSPPAIENFAQQFSVDRFRTEMRRIVHEAVESARVKTGLDYPTPRPTVPDGGET
ncbi:glycosyltransferase [Halopelagius longus]|uniref:Glycosyltransferase n=1 Tax=Halopelagius longus TaxID=1236180 RepID=A0A1H1FR07_9EURY|nr:glycosyltransferase [Halopelagius longus]RDI70207.1 glycosyltransferase [Halopelagius longus]SDR03320.1 Glycosyltransferase involved in cell wall bisynthesis [Halopelagius longus]